MNKPTKKKNNQKLQFIALLDQYTVFILKKIKKHPFFSVMIVGIAMVIINFNTLVDSMIALWNKIDGVSQKIGKDEVREEYFKKQEIAYEIFLEVKANLKRSNLLIENKDRLLKQDFTNSQYSHYHPKFGIEELDRQLSHFYNNIQNKNMNYSIEELSIIKGLGDFIVEELDKYFCCKETERYNNQPKIVSGDTVRVIGKDLYCYHNYQTATGRY